MDDGQFNTVEIRSVTLDESGIYTATATNEHGSLSCHCNLVVDKGIKAYSAPEFVERMKSDYVVDGGGEIFLTAQIEAHPSVGLKLYRNNMRIRPCRRIRLMLSKDGFVQLYISNATDDDAGIYKCIATNPAGNADCECCVVVEKNLDVASSSKLVLPLSKDPAFKKKLRSFKAFEGDTVIIDLEVVGDPHPDVIWLRDYLKVKKTFISLVLNLF